MTPEQRQKYKDLISRGFVGGFPQLAKALSEVIKEWDDQQSYINELSKDLCQLQDALDCPCEMTNLDGSIKDNQKAALERIRDLIAAEGELGDLKEKLKH